MFGPRRVEGPDRPGVRRCLCRVCSLTSHCLSLAVHCLSLALHCLSLTFHCLCRVCSLTSHCLCFGRSLPLHCLSLAFHCLCRVCSLTSHCLCFGRSLPLHCLYTAFPWPSTACIPPFLHCLSLAFYCPYTAVSSLPFLGLSRPLCCRSLASHCLPSAFTPPLHRLYTAFTPPFRYDRAVAQIIRAVGGSGLAAVGERNQRDGTQADQDRGCSSLWCPMVHESRHQRDGTQADQTRVARLFGAGMASMAVAG